MFAVNVSTRFHRGSSPRTSRARVPARDRAARCALLPDRWRRWQYTSHRRSPDPWDDC